MHLYLCLIRSGGLDGEGYMSRCICVLVADAWYLIPRAVRRNIENKVSKTCKMQRIRQTKQTKAKLSVSHRCVKMHFLVGDVRLFLISTVISKEVTSRCWTNRLQTIVQCGHFVFFTL